MSDFLYTRLRTPRQRGLAVFILCALILLLLRMSAGTIWQPRVAALVPAAMAIILLMRFRGLWRMARYGLMRWEMRMVRSWRAYAKKPPIVEALQLLGIGIGLLSMSGLLTGLYSDMQTGALPAVAVLALAGVCEITVQTKRVLKQAWAQMAGKIVSVSLGVILTAVTVSMAKQTVHSLAHVDPKYMAEFTAAVAAGLLPLVFLGTAAALLLLWAILQMVLLGAVFFGGILLEQAKPLVGERLQNRVRLFWYRIRTGRRPPHGVLPTAGFMPQHEVSLVGSMLSKVAVVWVLAQAGKGLAVAAPETIPLLTKVMVRLEYRPAPSCRNLAAPLGVVYMDDGNVSVARLKNGLYQFTVEKCELSGGA